MLDEIGRRELTVSVGVRGANVHGGLCDAPGSVVGFLTGSEVLELLAGGELRGVEP